MIRHFRLPDNETSESNGDGLVGLGIGLMAPFDLSTCHVSRREAEEKDEAEVEGVLMDVADELAPPSKKRRVTFG